MMRWIAFLSMLLGAVAACSAPAGDGSSAPGDQPQRSPAPVAPAVQTDQPDDEEPIPVPTTPGPVAPRIELDHPEHDEPIPWPSESDPDPS